MQSINFLFVTVSVEQIFGGEPIGISPSEFTQSTLPSSLRFQQQSPMIEQARRRNALLARHPDLEGPQNQVCPRPWVSDNLVGTSDCQFRWELQLRPPKIHPQRRGSKQKLHQLQNRQIHSSLEAPTFPHTSPSISLLRIETTGKFFSFTSPLGFRRIIHQKKSHPNSFNPRTNDKVSATCFPAMFNFGDSSSDTGGNHAAFPTETAAEYPPYGQTYFGAPQARYSDGRLYIDFLTEVFGLRYLDPYFQSVTSDFATGVNFAIAWSTAQKILDYKTLFPLATQVQQFQLFKMEVAEVLSGASALLAERGLQPVTTTTSSTVEESQHPYKTLYSQLFGQQNVTVDSTATAPDPALKDALEVARRVPLMEYFDQGLYIISTGTNDFNAGIAKQQTLSQIQAYLPNIVSAISDAVTAIYNEGARNILVGGVGPIGCLPVQLTVLTYTVTDLDNFGCVAPWNTLARSYNVLLKQQLVNLTTLLPSANIIYMDNYQLQHNLLFNGTENGVTVGLKSCCGVPSSYNFNPRVQCGETGIIDGGVYLESVTCPDPTTYSVWDGYHYTEAANRYFVQQLLSGRYFDPPFSLTPANCTTNTI
ncbi:hypothetical protein R1flu_026863 [Riccia fluitans]|uniref:GDSL esterase/lipase n=1 Tax=Riccia fluitans TaxID=41844 RepID=A0ABD1XHN6_9MARC